MKKIMIILAAVALAASANAAAIDWKVSAAGVKGYDGSAQVNIGAGATVYLVLSSAMSDVTAAINAGTFSESTAGVLGSQLTTKATGATDTATVASGFGTGVGVGDDVTLRVLVVDNTHDETGATWFKFSGELTKALYDETASPVVPNTMTFASTQWGKGTEWTKAVQTVPEPTSGILMLVGLGALALRRRHA